MFVRDSNAVNLVFLVLLLSLFVNFFFDFQDDFFKFYSDESDGLSLEDTDDASESETYHNRLASQSINANCNPQSKHMKEQSMKTSHLYIYEMHVVMEKI